MADHLLLALLLSLPLLLLFSFVRSLWNSSSSPSKVPIAFPIIGSIFAIWRNKERRVQWTADIVNSTPTLTFTLHRPFGYKQVFTGNAANLEHVLKSRFYNYPKGEVFRHTLRDFLGDGIFNADGGGWKFQRQVSSHQFNTRSLRRFVETVVDEELSYRLIPILQRAAETGAVLDLQDVLQRFGFDNVCKIAFGYDPAYLSPSQPEADFAAVFERALKLTAERFNSNIPFVWRIKRALCIGKERELKRSVEKVREFAKEVIRRKEERNRNTSIESEDILSRFLNSGYSDEDLITDVVISFILAGRDTTSAALTWFFWQIYTHPEVEKRILKEIEQKSDDLPVYDEVKSLVYTHASICETMRLYPPVPVGTKWALDDDVLPDGTPVKRGTRIGYHPYAMGRSDKVWGADCGEFRPDRWLQAAAEDEKWVFVARDPFTYPVFQAGPRICLGKEMAFLQMKRVAAGVLRRFKVAPAAEGWEPVYTADFTSKMKGGFPVRIVVRGGS